MKKNLILSFAAAVLLVASCAPKAYEVKVTFPDNSKDGQTAYIKDRSTSNRIDSAVVAEGVALFQGSVDQPVHALIGIGRQNIECILENAPYEITFAANPREQKPATGGVLNEAYNQFRNKVTEAQAPVREAMQKAQSDPQDLKARAQMDSIYKAYSENMKTLANDTYAANKDNLLGAIMFGQLLGDASDEETAALIAEASDVVKSYGPVAGLIKRKEQLQATAEGKMFTDFTITSEGKTVKFSDYIGKGKYVLVDFWASWCGPCRAEIPNLKSVYEKYNGDRFTILGVAVWDKLEDTKKAMEEEALPWDNIVDAQNIPTDLYGIEGIPQIMLFGPDGTIVARNLRGGRIGEKIAEVLAQ